MPQQRIPDHIEGRLGYYALAGETSISNGTWEAARASANVALTAQAALKNGEREAFALCRPPGHHAERRNKRETREYLRHTAHATILDV